MKRFNWTRDKTHYGKKDPIFYYSDKHDIGLKPHQKRFMKAMIETRANGPNTAFASITTSVEWLSDRSSHWGWNLARHFFGHHAGQKARAWCNYLLNNPPSHIRKWEGH